MRVLCAAVITVLTLQITIAPVHAQDLNQTATIKPLLNNNGFSSTAPLIILTNPDYPPYKAQQQAIKLAKLKKQQAEEALAKQLAAQKAVADAQAALLAQQQAIANQQAQDALTHSKHVATNFVAGNDYDFGNCTWYVANRRAVSAGLGNARDWLYNAQAIGMLTGSTPRVGAVAWQEPGYSLGHVAYVESVNADGSFQISEMNVVGFDATDYRTIYDTSNWQFIY